MRERDAARPSRHADAFDAPMAGSARSRRGNDRPLVLGIGRTTRPGSSTERVLRAALEEVSGLGLGTAIFTGPELCFPPYAGPGRRDEGTQKFLRSIGEADALIIATPSYHGSISGLVKNAIDYTEDLRDGPRVYFDGMPVGCICCAGGWQAAAHTLGTLRSIVHALRGWPTPVGAVVNTSMPLFAEDGRLGDSVLQTQLATMAAQIAGFLGVRSAHARPDEVPRSLP